MNKEKKLTVKGYYFKSIIDCIEQSEFTKEHKIELIKELKRLKMLEAKK